MEGSSNGCSTLRHWRVRHLDPVASSLDLRIEPWQTTGRLRRSIPAGFADENLQKRSDLLAAALRLKRAATEPFIVGLQSRIRIAYRGNGADDRNAVVEVMFATCQILMAPIPDRAESRRRRSRHPHPRRPRGAWRSYGADPAALIDIEPWEGAKRCPPIDVSPRLRDSQALDPTPPLLVWANSPRFSASARFDLRWPSMQSAESQTTCMDEMAARRRLRRNEIRNRWRGSDWRLDLILPSILADGRH